jgi:hypothetical protein
MTLLDDARRLWATLAGAPVAFRERELSVVVSPTSLLCPPGWVGVVTLGDAAIATAPDARQADRLRQTWTTFNAIAETVAWVDILGPATLAYLAAQEFRAAGGVAETGGDLGPLFAATGPDDLDESGLADITSPAFTVAENGVVVAAAGYRRWLDRAAHLSVLTAPAHRARGLAATVASAAVADALAHGLLPQWRARVEHSQRIARALGFRELGAQISLRLAGD